MEISRICTLVEERKNELFELLASLVRINSESYGERGNEKELAEHIKGICESLGMEAETYSPLDIEGMKSHPDYMEGRNLENRLNVTARWRGRENVDELMLMGHLDTVEVGDLSNWSFDPFAGEIRDGRVYGRGACDDKYALATALFIIKLLSDEGFVPSKNLVFSGYCDEEHGGSHGALAAVLKAPVNRIVNMDGRLGQIWNCASGGGEGKFVFRMNRAVDSAEYIAKAIPTVLSVMEEHFGKNRREELAANSFYDGSKIPQTALRYMGVRAGKDGTDLGVGEIYITYYTDKSKEEIFTALDKVRAILSEKLAPLDASVDPFLPTTRHFHYTHCDKEDAHIADFVKAAVLATGKEPLVCGSCLSDLSVISKYGTSHAFAYGCGRDFSLEGGAHQPNEFIECDKLVEFAKTIAAYVVSVL